MSSTELVQIDISQDALMLIEKEFKALYSGELGISTIAGGQSAANTALANLDIRGYANKRNQVLPKSARGATGLSLVEILSLSVKKISQGSQALWIERNSN